MTTISPTAMIPEWNMLQQIARCYLDVQKTRVAMELRSQKMIDQHLLKLGLAKEEFLNPEDDETVPERKRKSGRRIVHIESKDKEEQKQIEKRIEFETALFKTTSNAFKLIESHKKRMHKQEKDMLKESVALFETSELWKWCESVKGLGEVAGMTFVGYIDPTKAENVSKVWSYCGMTPNRKLKKGEIARFNPLLKGRFIGVIGQNIIRSADPYYSMVYRIKKEYYVQRPDLIDLFEKKPRGWKAHINRMAVRVLVKLIISHAFDILKYDRGMTDEIVIDHRNNIPLKPEDIPEQQRILERYRYNHAAFLEKLKLAWANDETEGKVKYYELLRHGEMNSGLDDDLGIGPKSK